MAAIFNDLKINRLWIIIAISLTYVITARLGLLLAMHPGFATAFWPPSGIAVAALLLFGYQIWPAILIGSFAANTLTSSHPIETALLVSSGIAIGSTLQPLAIYYLLNHLTNSIPHLLNTRRNMISFLLFTIFCCFISATIGLISLISGGVIPLKDFGVNWITWWLGDIAGIYVFTPFIFAWAMPFDFKSYRFAEAALLLTLILAVSIICFGGWLYKGYPIEYMLIPLLVWSVFRFGASLSTFFLVIISIITILGTANGYGPFVQASLNESLLLLQAFIAIITSTTLLIISAINEIWHAQDVLEQFSQDLKKQVQHGTNALKVQSEQFQESASTIQNQTTELQAQLKWLEEQSKELMEENRNLKNKLETKTSPEGEVL